MTKLRIALGLTLAAVCLTAAVQAQEAAPAIRTHPPATTSGGSGQSLLNLEDTVALHGFDPVGYFNQNRAVKGSHRIKERLGGATYYFRSWRNRMDFLANAPKYQPQLGGYCVTSMARGRLEDINPDLFQIYDGKLYLFRDDEALAAFQRDPRRIIHEATQNYFRLAQSQRTTY
jgi:YHS domain-containing protein